MPTDCHPVLRRAFDVAQWRRRGGQKIKAQFSVAHVFCKHLLYVPICFPHLSSNSLYRHVMRIQGNLKETSLDRCEPNPRHWLCIHLGRCFIYTKDTVKVDLIFSPSWTKKKQLCVHWCLCVWQSRDPLKSFHECNCLLLKSLIHNWCGIPAQQKRTAK